MQKTDPKPTVIFVCEHGAAKSVIAAAYFNKMAQEIGLNEEAVARGINPDLELSQTTVAGLRKDGLTPDLSTTRKLSAEELLASPQVITYCKLPENYRYEKAIEYWDDVPPVSEDYEKARDSILIHIKHLINIS
jgi:arsenate reductase (thioredoxin)